MRHERSAGKGEKLIWIVRRQTSGDSGHTVYFTGEKALLDTLQNRELVKAAGSAQATPRDKPEPAKETATPSPPKRLRRTKRQASRLSAA